MHRSKIAATRVVQKHEHPERPTGNIVRIRYAPQIATAKTATCWRSDVERRVEDEREHDRDREPQDDHDDLPAREVRDVVVERDGRAAAAAPESSPSRIRHSQPYGVKTMFMFRTSVQTM